MARADHDAWYGETGRWVPHLDKLLRQRPSGHADPTDQDRYYDSLELSDDPEQDPPWLDTSLNHEAELC